MTDREIITAARNLSRKSVQLLPRRRNAEALARSWLRSQTFRQKALLTTALVLGVGLTVTLANQIGLDQQAAAGFYLAAITLLSGQCFPSSDGMPDVAEMQGKQQQPSQHKQPTSAFGCRLALPADTADVLIDHTGQIIPARDLPNHLGYPNPDFDLVAYAVRNCGMIYVSGPAVRLAPRLVSPHAIEVVGTLLTLRDSGEPIQLSAYENGAWRMIPCRSAIDAGQMLVHLIQRLAGPSFASQPDGLDMLPRIMRDAFLTWQGSGGELAEGSIAQLRATGAWDRTVALRRAEGDGLGFAFLHIGAGITAFGEAWRRRMIGKVDDGRPDAVYAANVSSLYRRSLDTNMPAANRVDAVLLIERRPEPVRLRYRQLLLPWTIHDGRRRRSILTSITERLLPEPHHASA